MMEQDAAPTQTDAALSPNASASASRIRIPTPSIDQSIILDVMDTRLSQIKSSFQQQQQQQADGNNPAKTSFFIHCMDDTAASLKHQITNLTEPIDDDSLYPQLDRLESRHLAVQAEDDSDASSSSSSEEEEVDISFDDDDVFDTEAYAKVKELRDASRDVARRVTDTRREAVGRALDVAERGVGELLKVHGYTDEEEQHQAQQQSHQVVGEEGGETTDRTVVEPLRAALRNLSASLEANSDLGVKLHSIRETIATIDAAADRGGENAISQTEKAMAEAAAAMKHREEEGRTMGEETLNDADAILARLLAGAL